MPFPLRFFCKAPWSFPTGLLDNVTAGRDAGVYPDVVALCTRPRGQARHRNFTNSMQETSNDE